MYVLSPLRPVSHKRFVAALHEAADRDVALARSLLDYVAYVPARLTILEAADLVATLCPGDVTRICDLRPLVHLSAAAEILLSTLSDVFAPNGQPAAFGFLYPLRPSTLLSLVASEIRCAPQDEIVCILQQVDVSKLLTALAKANAVAACNALRSSPAHINL